MNKQPLKYYLKKNNQEKWKDFKECFQHYKKEITEYYEEHGKDGFLSERIHKRDIENIARKKANRDWNEMNNCKLQIDWITVNPKTEKEQILQIENTKTFVRWIENESN